jgi:streptomycin 6-kinase
VAFGVTVLGALGRFHGLPEDVRFVGRCPDAKMYGVAERFVIPDDLAAAAAKERRGDWLAKLPVLVAQISAEWQIEVYDSFLPGGATAWVAPARDYAGNDFVLKVCWRHPEAVHEADGLQAWDGAGAIRLYRAIELVHATVLLLERCRPGTQLRASPPEEHDIVIAGLLRRLWTDPAPGHCFRPLSDMCEYWASRYEERSPAERSCLEAPLAKEGIRLLRELPRSGGGALLLHTDLHAGNVLAAEREPWLAIDPKPYVGDPAYDVTQHIFNGVFVEGADAGALASRMARLLDLDLDLILLWLFARSVEASPYWTGMADLARTLYSSLT